MMLWPRVLGDLTIVDDDYAGWDLGVHVVQVAYAVDVLGDLHIPLNLRDRLCVEMV
jgi:hypothetical protein